MQQLGIDTVVYTDIEKDGMLSGPNIKSTQIFKEKTGLNVIASGGVSSISDIKNLLKIDVYGVITGQAIYSGALDITDALALCEG